MKKFFFKTGLIVAAILIAYFSFIYLVTYSEGYRAGALVKISKRGVLFKTWEGRLSQGISDEQQFDFSIQSGDKEVIKKLKELQGKQVKLTYIERFGTFAWMGDTKYYVKEVEEVKNETQIEE